MKQTDEETTQIAAWASLALEDRVIDRLAAILFAAEQIQGMIDAEGEVEAVRVDIERTAKAVSQVVRSALPMLQRHTSAASGRGPELEEVLAALDRDLHHLERLRGPERDEALELVEEAAAPYALAFYYEIRRLDDLRIWGVSRLPSPNPTDRRL